MAGRAIKAYSLNMLTVHTLPIHTLTAVTKTTHIFTWELMVTKGGKWQHLCVVWCLATAIMAGAATWSIGFRVNAMGNQHFRIGINHCIVPAESHILHPRLNSIIIRLDQIVFTQ